MEPGRNDPCHCGSGKKYKHCCLNGPVDPLEGVRAHVSAAKDQLQARLSKYGWRKFADSVEEAWREFSLQEDEPFDAQEEDIGIFAAWFFTRWRDGDAPRRKAAAPGTVLGEFLKENGNHLSEMERLLAAEFWRQPWSFYEVVASQPGVGFRLRDILTSEEADVPEQTASMMSQVHDIFVTQLCHVGDIVTMNFAAPLLIPPRMKPDIISLRRDLRRRISRQGRPLRAADLIRREEDIRDTYFFIRDYLTAPIQVQNTDGEPLVLHKMTFEIESPERTFEALASLAVGVSKEELLALGERDGEGRLRKICFDWLKRGNRKMQTWENTILGSIQIEGCQLTAGANSEKRASRLRAEIEKRLGAAAVHKGTETESYASMQRGTASNPWGDDRASEDDLLKKEREEFAATNPEIRKKLQQAIDDEMATWVRKKIPALGGLTPMQAVKDPDGREMVEALLNEFERTAPGKLPGDVRPDIIKIRKALRLPTKERETSETPTLFEP